MSDYNYIQEYAAFDSFSISEVVCETQDKQRKEQRKTSAHYTLLYITAGCGFLRTKALAKKLDVGYVAIISPSCEWNLESDTKLEYIRITFFGTEAKILLTNQFKIDRTVKVYSGLESLLDLYKESLAMTSAIVTLRCKGLLYLTFAEIERRSNDSSNTKPNIDAPHRIKRFIDDNFTVSEINLNYIGENLSYHPNYISTVFTDEFGISVVKYINIQRIRHACFLMEQGTTSIKEIAYLCGYENPDYFSSVFKAQMGVTPKIHIKYITQASIIES